MLRKLLGKGAELTYKASHVGMMATAILIVIIHSLTMIFITRKSGDKMHNFTIDFNTHVLLIRTARGGDTA